MDNPQKLVKKLLDSLNLRIGNSAMKIGGDSLVRRMCGNFARFFKLLIVAVLIYHSISAFNAPLYSQK